MAIEIVSHIPCPAQVRTYQSKYPFDQLSVGQAFLISADEVTEKTHKTLGHSAAAYRNRTDKNIKFAIRKLDDGRVGVWRVQ